MTLLRLCMLTTLLAAAAGCATVPGEICSDYLSRSNCLGGWREVHHGIDFRGPSGTQVISATHGTVLRKLYSDCPGHGLSVRTDIVARHGDGEGPVFVTYWHMEALPDLKVSQKLKPGDPIGTIIPLRRTQCYGSAEHVHYEMRVQNSPRRHIDPHQFWADGPGKLTCFTPGMAVPAGKAVAPLRCSR